MLVSVSGYLGTYLVSALFAGAALRSVLCQNPALSIYTYNVYKSLLKWDLLEFYWRQKVQTAKVRSYLFSIVLYIDSSFRILFLDISSTAMNNVYIAKIDVWFIIDMVYLASKNAQINTATGCTSARLS